MESRCYHQHCGLARALDRLGERWTLLIVRDLLLGERRYSQLLEGLPGITTNLLAKRLKAMEEVGLIGKSGKGAAIRYRLTEMGAALEPAIMELARWGGRFMAQPAPGDRMDIGWALLSCKRRYLGGQDFRVAIECDRRRFELVFTPQVMVVQEHEAIAPQLRLRGSQEDLFGILFFSRVAPSLQVEPVEALGEFSRALGLGL